jgi:hypothetical protein
MQHKYQYSKWQSVHEPFNIVENVLQDDDSVFSALQPNFDFTLEAGTLCSLSEIHVWPGDVGP